MDLATVLQDICRLGRQLERFEKTYSMTSETLYDQYCAGQEPEDNDWVLDFAEWAGHYKLKLKREAALKQFSHQRVEELRRQAEGETIELALQEPVLELA